ncbi:MAG: hypothetical protein HKL96_11090 [Phycisphaerales bacterium]|nr:hypothetical protein [Phycisphaerales bacterium]
MPQAKISSIAAIKRMLESERLSGRPLAAALATAAGRGGGASARMVVVRGLDTQLMELWFSTDVRSAKVADLAAAPQGELCIWLHRLRVQVRLRCRWRIIGSSASRGRDRARWLAAWGEHSPHARRLFAGAMPGKSYANGRAAIPTTVGGEPPESFALCVGRVLQIDALVLGRPQHQRHVHQRVGRGWQSRRVNP